MAGADRMTIEEVVKDVLVREHGDVLRAAVEVVCAELMEREVSAQIGAELGERRPDDRMTHRNGWWLVGRRYLSAESISLVLAGEDDHTDQGETSRRWRSSKRPEPPTSPTT